MLDIAVIRSQLHGQLEQVCFSLCTLEKSFGFGIIQYVQRVKMSKSSLHYIFGFKAAPGTAAFEIKLVVRHVDSQCWIEFILETSSLNLACMVVREFALAMKIIQLRS